VTSYELVDADNHYYEAEDAFTRYGDDNVRRFVRWVQEGNRRHLLFGNRVSTLPRNPTFDPVSRPGAYHERLKELAEGRGQRGLDTLDFSRYGELEPPRAEYRDRDARLEVMNDQNVERVFLFPTLADCVEGLLYENPQMAYASFSAFNRWLFDDWGYSYKDRLYAAPYIPMIDPQMATAELEAVLDRGAKLISIRPGPANGRSSADPIWDPFWSRVNESEILVAYHAFGGASVYQEQFDRMWGQTPVADPTYQRILAGAIIADRGILDTCLALVLGNLFGRFPKMRVASVEMGCAWVPYALHTLDHAGGLLERHIEAFGAKLDRRPSEVFKEHIWVSPFPEDDVVGLTELIGVEHVLFGSDWPHPEGNIAPADYVRCIEALDPEAIRKIMRDNALSLIS
jgi:predicted TIM-barrel fold metal-dependent hydrolase